MLIPRYWASADHNGYHAYGWSASSQEDAQRLAMERAKRVEERFLEDQIVDRYPYGAAVAIRELCVERITDTTGETTAALTRNRYGALVLNAARLAMADIDLPEPKVPSLLGRLFGRKPEQPARDPVDSAIRSVEALINSRKGAAARVYRTKMGVRVLFTDTPRDVASAIPMLEEVGTDPVYVRLCESQQCFRARLTPKPWRCGHRPANLSFPFPTPAGQQRFQQWDADYKVKSQGYATAKFLRVLGNPTVHAEFTRLVAIHDQWSKAESSMPLA